MNDELPCFANRLTEMMSAANLSCDELARDTGLHESYLAALLQGTKEPSAEVIDRLSRYFEISADMFMSDPSEDTFSDGRKCDTRKNIPSATRPKEAEAFSRVFAGAPLSEAEHRRWVAQIYDESGSMTPDSIIFLIGERIARSTASLEDKELVLQFLARDWHVGRMLASGASAAVAFKVDSGQARAESSG